MSRGIKQTDVEKRKRNNAAVRRFNRTLNGTFSILKNNAKHKKIEVTISFNDFCILREGLCYYCNGSLPEAGGGIDRINPRVGYVQGNCRPCCIKCNKAKNDMTEIEYREWLLMSFYHWASK